MNEIIFTLSPTDNTRLQSLCGAFDEHLALIEKSFNLSIARQGFVFTLMVTEDTHHSATLLPQAAKLIQQLYVETAPIK